MTGSKVALDSVIGIYTEGGGDETVTLTDCTGYLGSGDPGNGYMAIASYGADSNVKPADKIFINNLDPNLYTLGVFSETDDQGNVAYYGAAVYAKDGSSYHMLLGIQPTGITLDMDTLTLYLNREGQGTQNLQATVIPDDVTEKTVTWSSSDTSVATVDDKGNVTAVGKGDAVYRFTVSGDIALTAVFEEHTVTEGWKSDAGAHWKECSVCGEKLEETAHTSAWVTDKEAAAAEAGSKHEECTVCGYKKAAVEIPATGTAEDPAGPSADAAVTSPKTGESSYIALWLAVLLAAGATLTGALYIRKRKHSR